MRYLLVCLALAAAPAAAQNVEIFIPNQNQGQGQVQVAPSAPVIQNRLAACLANPNASTCTGVSAETSDGVQHETVVGQPQIQFETLILDLGDGGGVTSSQAPPPAQVDYDKPVQAKTVSLPAVAVTIEFDFDSDAIRYDQFGKITGLTQAFQDPALAGYSFAVIGHTDAKGSAGYNCDLSRRRAAQVVGALQANYVQLTLYPIGFGEHVLKNTYDPAAAENRRVTFLRLPADAGQVLQTSYQLCGFG